jgi:hypothetical protein
MNSQSVSIPIVCETPGCPNNGSLINRISEYPADLVDAFFEDYDGSVLEDRCPLCGEAGIAQDPEPE